MLVLRVLRARLVEHVSSCRTGYWLALSLLALGVATGSFAVRLLDPSQRAMLSMAVLHAQASESAVRLAASATVRALAELGVWTLLGFSVVGVPLLAAAVGVRGFTIGFASAFLVTAFGGRGAVAVAFALLPTALPLMAGQILAAAVLFRFAASVWPSAGGARKYWTSIGGALPALGLAASLLCLSGEIESLVPARVLALVFAGMH